MKKVLLILLALSSLALAEVKDIGITAGYVNLGVGRDTGRGYDIGVKYSDYFKNYFIGGRFAYQNGSYVDREVSPNVTRDISGYEADFKLGMTPVKDNIAVYGIVAAVYQSIGDNDYTGIGAGVGVEFRITDLVSMNIDYTQVNMNPIKSSVTANYTYEKTMCSLGLNF